jgi:Domain of unknown function (DUF1905)
MKLAKLQETKSTIRFSAKLSRIEPTEKIGSWTLTLPKNASAKLPSRGRTMVEGTINSFPFRAALEPNGKGSHWLRVNKTMRDAAGADAADTVTVEITRATHVKFPISPEIRFWEMTSSLQIEPRLPNPQQLFALNRLNHADSEGAFAIRSMTPVPAQTSGDQEAWRCTPNCFHPGHQRIRMRRASTERRLAR